MGSTKITIVPSPEGPYIQLLRNQAPKYHSIEGVMGPNSLMVVYVDPLGSERKHDDGVHTLDFT